MVCKRACDRKSTFDMVAMAFSFKEKVKRFFPTLSTFLKSLFHLIDDCSQKEKLFRRRTQQSTLVKKLDLVNQKIGKNGAKETKN